MWKTIYLKEEEEVFEENNLFEDISEENGLLENRSPVMEVVSIPTVANLENYPVIAGLSHSTDVNDRIQQEMGGSIENDVRGYGFSSYDFSQIYDQYPSSAGYDLAKLSDNAQKSVLSPTGSGCNLTGRSDQSQISHQSQSGSGSNMTKPSGKSQISVQPPTGNLAGAPVGVGEIYQGQKIPEEKYVRIHWSNRIKSEINNMKVCTKKYGFSGQKLLDLIQTLL